MRVTVSSATEFSSAAGQVVLGTFAASVPDTAPYGDKEVLDLSAVEVGDASPTPQSRPAADDDGVHLAAFFGDTNGSRGYSGGDTTQLQRVIVGAQSGFSAYRLADPVIVADLNNNGTLTGGDTTQLQRVIVGLPAPSVPALPTGTNPLPPDGLDPMVFIPTDLSAAPGQTITVPVMLTVTEAGGVTLSSADVAVTYDSTKFTVGNVRLGGLLTGGSVTAPFAITSNTDIPGVIRITGSAPEETALLPHDTTGALYLIDFTVAATAQEGPSVVNLRQSEGPTTTGVENLGGPLTLSPAPTDQTTTVDGVITIAGPGALAFAAAAVTVDEGAGTATITVTRTGSTTGAVGVSYAVTGGTATAGADYALAAGTLSFADGEVSKTFTVGIVDDLLAEGNETVVIGLSNPTGGATLGGTSTTTLTIADNEPALLSVTVNDTGNAPVSTFTYSRVTKLVLTFNTAVSAVDPGAFALTRGATTLTSGGAVSVSGFGTNVLTLTFAGTTGVESGSLADGVWTLATDLTKVKNGVNTVGTGRPRRGTSVGCSVTGTGTGR